MNRGTLATGLMLGALACVVVALAPLASAATPRPDRALEAQVRAHIQTLASDEFQGREPGTEGESKTLRYLVDQWFGMGLVSGTNDPGNEWFAPVVLVERTPQQSIAQFYRGGRRLYVPADATLVLTSGKRSLLRDAPVIFVGNAAGTLPRRGELAGRVALLLDGGIDNSERQTALLAAGASAVLTVLDGERSLDGVSARRKRSGYALASDALGGDLDGFITRYAMDRLLQGLGTNVSHLQAQAARSDFVPQLLDLTTSLEATTSETTIRTHNLIGKIPGKRPDSGAVLFVAHWDHFGQCASPPAEDQVCNGAIDNASGLAVMTETARRLANGAQPDRDIYFLATTAEEFGLLGAHAFAENPPMPIKRIVAAFNIDSVAIAPAGSPLAIVGRGMTPLDRTIEDVARRQKRQVVQGGAANAYVRRQDGWALLQHDIPAVMVTSAYADIARMERFFDSTYHRPGDDNRAVIELGGAVEDISFYVALGRWFGDLRKVPIGLR